MRIINTLLFLFITVGLSAQVEVNNGGGWFGSGDRVKGNGDVQTERRDIDGFTGVKACCSMKVELAEGPFSVRVEAESNLQEFVKTVVNGRQLEIGYTDKANFRSTEPINVYVTLPKLEYLKASSSSTVYGTSDFHGDDLEVHVSSSALAELTFIGDEVTTGASSSATLRLSGRADRIEADASSSGRIDAGKLESRDGRADVSSSADVVLNLSKSLRAKASSSGSVTYYGSPNDVHSDTSSSGSVRSRN
ncbi:head GIN domain-containing protein [Lewinella sp. IMCC34183]|uniref:head GIN domain-containing protein n=1 Tax=Lewinella sp. IMCC34183 TaxID=2248762 RepID=UPI000E21EAED|nr:head GIN domain-containing protein [Lewinella sp. IMCC34183]